MRGSPLLRGILVFLAILALGWPLRFLTQKEESAVASAEAATQAQQPDKEPESTELEVSFSRIAQRIEIRHLGNVIWEKNNPALQETVSLQLRIPKEGVELQVNASFEGGGASVVRCRMNTEHGETYDRSVWGAEQVNAVVPFP